MSSRTAVATAAKIDGRRQRAELTRQKIVDATIALSREGNHRPALQEISERAGISLRTVFDHFPEKHLLTEAVLAKLTPFDRADPPPPGLVKHSKLKERIALLLDMRTTRLEEITPDRQVSNALIATSPRLQKHRLKVRKFYRDVVEAWFAVELDQLDSDLRQRWLIALATLVDWEMWWSLRTYPDRSIAECKAMLNLLLTAALNEMDAAARGNQGR